MNYLDLFSGIGGFHLGLEQAGFKFDWVGLSEIDKYATQIYRKRFPDAEELGSIESIRPETLPRINLITFGFPCQDLSVAGKRKGISAERSGLFFEAMRIIEYTKPDIFIFENVKGLFSSNNGRDFQTVLQTIADIGLYECEWQLCNTRWFLPQNRERVYFVGHLRGRSRPKVFPFRESDEIFTKSRREGKASNQFSTAITQNLKRGVHSGGETLITISNPKPRDYKERKIVKARPVLTPDSFIQVGTLRTHNDGKGFRAVKGGDCPTIPSRAREDGSGQPVIKIGKINNSQSGAVYSTDGVSATITGCGGGQGAKTGLYQVESGTKTETKIRRLTPREASRLQGFPDWWTDGLSDTQKYKCLGNAVSVPVVKAIGERLL